MSAYNTNQEAEAKTYKAMKHRIFKAQGKAKAIGFFYLIATLAITALACFPLLAIEGAQLGVMEFWKPFLELSSGFAGKEIVLAVAVLYALMLLILLINVIRCLCKLSWLFKKKASKLYGFNRNMYAMDDMGKIFAASFKAIVILHMLIVFIVGGAMQFTLFGYIVLGVGVFFHFVCGIASENVSLFTTENGITEESRKVGNVAPFIRNLLQIAAVAGMVYFFSQISIIRAAIDALLAENGLQTALSDYFEYLVYPGVQVLMLACMIGMIAYAFGVKEFDMQGAKAAGRGWYLFLCIMQLILTAGWYGFLYFAAGDALPMQWLYIAGIALVMIVWEICTLRFPRIKVVNPDEVDADKYVADYDDDKEIRMSTPTAQNANIPPYVQQYLPAYWNNNTNK